MNWLVRACGKLFDYVARKLLNLKGDITDGSSFEKRKSSLDNRMGQAVEESFSVTDAKNTALLTHVSIMIAITGLLFSSESNEIFHVFYGFEIIAYLFIAMVCLRNLIPKTCNGLHEYKTEAVYREKLFEASAKATIFFSILLLVFVIAELVLGIRT